MRKSRVAGKIHDTRLTSESMSREQLRVLVKCCDYQVWEGKEGRDGWMGMDGWIGQHVVQQKGYVHNCMHVIVTWDDH
ncbi:hypothetical protein PRIPAC_84946 [Pristionchus pacificus]|uniref:Uncharacterized protein n=1 Tax=Pristionchus pacificus TaxID=54126 RepID=A0A2A6CED7_PRIPA|nr:hypothetical protein PRIPAC_84946 [Pristionchus pacificus]|eukprot:PDM76562.1 hypothetical protein PRIPAC_42928 [Pristionchus pacificus]